MLILSVFGFLENTGHRNHMKSLPGTQRGALALAVCTKTDLTRFANHPSIVHEKRGVERCGGASQVPKTFMDSKESKQARKKGRKPR